MIVEVVQYSIMRNQTTRRVKQGAPRAREDIEYGHVVVLSETPESDYTCAFEDRGIR